MVLALPDMMSATGLELDELQRAAPIVSGFLLGYVAVLPLIGRISDLRGRVPVLLGSLAVFAVGSLITAAAYNLETIVAGRLIQGIGGGGLIPPTLALVADMWPPKRRGLPLGIVGAVQELGSVVGPLYGAVVLAFGDWRDIFWLNCAIGLVLAAAMLRHRDPVGPGAVRTGRRDYLGMALGGADADRTEPGDARAHSTRPGRHVGPRLPAGHRRLAVAHSPGADDRRAAAAVPAAAGDRQQSA